MNYIFVARIFVISEELVNEIFKWKPFPYKYSFCLQIQIMHHFTNMRPIKCIVLSTPLDRDFIWLLVWDDG